MKIGAKKWRSQHSEGNHDNDSAQKHFSNLSKKRITISLHYVPQNSKVNQSSKNKLLKTLERIEKLELLRT